MKRKNKLTQIAVFSDRFSEYIKAMPGIPIMQSSGLGIHIEKRHPECVKYMSLIPSIIQNPDYIGVNPNETSTSFELVKTISEHIQIGIKLEPSEKYFYVATLHTITTAKLEHNLSSGRLVRFDK